MADQTEVDRRRWEEKKQRVLRATEGRWRNILSAMAPMLQDVIAMNGKHTWCPNPAHQQRHGDAMRTLRNFDETGGMVCNTCGNFPTGINVLMWLYGWSYGKTIHEIDCHINGMQGGYRAIQSIAPVQRVADDPVKSERAAQKLKQVWDQSVALDTPTALVGRTYLQNRGIADLKLPMPEVRFHPGLEYYSKPEDKDGKPKLEGRFPAIVYIIRTAEGLVGTLQRIYLQPDGSGKLQLPDGGDAKKMMPRRADRPVTGGSAWLDAPSLPVMQITEGFENGMSVRLLVDGIPTAVASSDTLLANFRIPEHIHFLAIWGDWDQAGVEHARALEARVREQGRRAVCIFPQYEIPGKHKIDWNDALQYFGVEQLRRQSFYRAYLNGLKEKLSGAGFMQAAERIGNIA